MHLDMRYEVPLDDDAHLMPTAALRPLRLVFEDFPAHCRWGHNLVRLGQPELLYRLSLTVNEDIRSRVTDSVQLLKLAPHDMRASVLRELGRVALTHRVFSPEALDLIVRSGEGVLRRTRNLCVSGLLEAVRARVRMLDLKQVNRVLLQPHWRQQEDVPDLP